MATSGTYTWSTTTASIINGAFAKINRKSNFETITAGDPRWTDGLEALNAVVKANAAHGMPLWAIADTTIPFSNWSVNPNIDIGIGGTINTVAPLKIIQAVRQDTTQGVNVPIVIYTQDYYESLSQPLNTGTPIGMYYHPLGPADSNRGEIFLWLVPDTYWTTNGQLYIRYQRPFQDMVASGDEPDFPPYWQLALIYQVAYYLAPNYGLDATQRGFLKKDMDFEVDKALSFGTEEGYFSIQPRLRS